MSHSISPIRLLETDWEPFLSTRKTVVDLLMTWLFLAYTQYAVEIGRVTTAHKYTNAKLWSVNDDYVVWSAGNTSFNHQRLSRGNFVGGRENKIRPVYLDKLLPGVSYMKIVQLALTKCGQVVIWLSSFQGFQDGYKIWFVLAVHVVVACLLHI